MSKYYVINRVILAEQESKHYARNRIIGRAKSKYFAVNRIIGRANE